MYEIISYDTLPANVREQVPHLIAATRNPALSKPDTSYRKVGKTGKTLGYSVSLTTGGLLNFNAKGIAK